MEPTVYRPRGDLARFVDYFWTFEWNSTDGGRTLKMFATGVSGILFQHHDGRPALGARTTGHDGSRGGCPTSFVYGKRTRPSQTFSRGAFGLTGVVFKPQGLSTLLHTQPIGLSDGSVALDDFSRERIGERLLNAHGPRERVARLWAYLRAQVDGSSPEDTLVTESLRLIQARIRSIRIPHVLQRLRLSERQFERRFIRAIGVSPHTYLRIARFQEALQLIRARRFERLADVAYDLNYADQSHFIKDVKAFSGCTPTELAQTVQAGISLPCALIVAPTRSDANAGPLMSTASCGVNLLHAWA